MLVTTSGTVYLAGTRTTLRLKIKSAYQTIRTMSFFGKIAEQAKVAAMAQIPAAIAASKGPIIDAIKTYIQKNPGQADVIKRNLAEISAGVQTAGSRKKRRTLKMKAGRRLRKTRGRGGMKIPESYKPYANIIEEKKQE